MSKVLIAGIGNVLLGDDGVGPFAIKVLESEYDFPENVELADLGTPGRDLPVHLTGADVVILVDSAKFGGEAGDIRLFRKQDILRNPPRGRIDPHSNRAERIHLPAATHGSDAARVSDDRQGSRFEPGSTLSTGVRHCVPHIIEAVQSGERQNRAPKAALLVAEKTEVMRKSLAGLPAESREVLVLREMEQLSYREIADIAGIPLGAVMSRLGRARQRLQHTLSGCSAMPSHFPQPEKPCAGRTFGG